MKVLKSQYYSNTNKMQNPFLVFQDEQNDEIFPETKNLEQGSTFSIPQNNTKYPKIKNRKIKRKLNFGRGANHPSFFLRKFFSKLTSTEYQKIYSDSPQILQRIVAKANHLKTNKNRFKLDDLKDTFGETEGEQGKMENYLNSKMFFKAISDMSLQMIMEESKCSHVLNHLISIEKYSSRLGNPLLAGRVQFQ